MRREALRYFAVAMMIAAAAFIAFGVADGRLHIGFLLIIPIIYGSGAEAVAPALLVFLAFVLFAISSTGGQEGEAGTGYNRQQDTVRETAKTRRAFGGVIFIGPVPIVFGSDRRITGYMIVAAVVILILLLIAFFAGLF